jgi:hypothetical protein
MDKYYVYDVPKGGDPKTRYSLEKFIYVLKEFYIEYTDTVLDKIKFEYRPNKISDPDDYNHWVDYNNNFAEEPYLLQPLETDEEIEKTLRNIDNLELIKADHIYKGSKRPYVDISLIQPYDQHTYEVNINSYHELLNIINEKNSCSSSLTMIIDKGFNFKYYDYSKLNEIFKNCEKKNNIWFYISNSRDKKCYHSIDFSIIFPIFSESEKELLREIQKKLKIKFTAKYFGYYYIGKNGKPIYRKERVDI